MAHKPTEVIALDGPRFEALLQRVEAGTLAADDLATIHAVLESYFYVTQLIDRKNTSLARLRQLLFGAKTEKTADVIGRDTPAATEPSSPSHTAALEASDSPPAVEPPQPHKPGHGRRGAQDYPGAAHRAVRHESLQAGDACPACARGTVYERHQPGVLIRFVGQPPIQATVYELQKLRCQLCGQVFTAQAPPEAGAAKYDATVGSMLALLKYGNGFPFHREAKLQQNLQIPLPASTQWELLAALVPLFQPILEALIRQAAQGELLHNDDTRMKILSRLSLLKQQRLERASAASTDEAITPSGRQGTFTSGIVALHAERPIALFFTGARHAGENPAEVLRRRATDLPPPIQMCDALSHNRPADFATILAHCLAHARRQFVDVHDRFPSECAYVLQVFEAVYRHDAQAREQRLSAAARLQYHQIESAPLWDELRTWLKRQVEEKLVERNSGLGAAIEYLRKHWEPLTLFLRVAGAPLDNNVVERALKKAILHRKNALFYKTQRGADVGDLYMSLIHTCELNGANPFDYLTQVQRHAEQVAAAPECWLPWNYREQLEGKGRCPDAA